MGSALPVHVEGAARAAGLGTLITETSLTARPVFERAGFRTLQRRDLVMRGVAMDNVAMDKALGGSGAA